MEHSLKYELCKMTISLKSGLCFIHGVLLTLAASNLVFLDFLGIFSGIVSTTAFGLLFILFIFSSTSLRVRKVDIGYQLLLVLMLLFALRTTSTNVSDQNVLYAFRDSIWLLFCILILFLDVNLRYFVGLTKITTLLMVLSLGVVVFLAWYLGISLKEVNVNVYKDLDQASMINKSSLADQFRFTLPGLNANTTGTILLVNFLMVFCLLRDEYNNLSSSFYYLILLVLGFFFLATFSKTVLVLLVVSGALLAYGRLITATKLIFYSVAGAVVVWIVEPLVIYRLVSVYDIIAGTEIGDEFVGRTSNRSESLLTSWKLIANNPFGMSFDNYGEAARSGSGGGEHNNYIYMTAVYGIPFGVLYFIYFLLVVSNSFICFKRQKLFMDPYSTRLSLLSLIIAVCILLAQFVAPTPVYALILSSLCLLINKTVANERALLSNHL
jgi:hypothetical protein